MQSSPRLQQQRRERVREALQNLRDTHFWRRCETAAAILDTTPDALRQQLRRAPIEVIDGIAVHVIGDGLVLGIKADGRWLVHVVTPNEVMSALRAS